MGLLSITDLLRSLQRSQSVSPPSSPLRSQSQQISESNSPEKSLSRLNKKLQSQSSVQSAHDAHIEVTTEDAKRQKNDRLFKSAKLPFDGNETAKVPFPPLASVYPDEEISRESKSSEIKCNLK